MTVTIPAFMLTTPISVEPYEGETGASGPKYGAAVEVKAHVEPRRRLIVMKSGREERTDLFAIVAPGLVCPPESRITYLGRTYRVIGVFDVPAPGGGVHHIEIGFTGRGSSANA